MAFVSFRVNDEDLKNIEQNAKECALSRSKYLRQVALGTVPRSKFDKQVAHELYLLHGDIGRVGGLLKWWLTKDEDFRTHQNLNINQLVLEIKQLKKSINHLIERL